MDLSYTLRRATPLDSEALHRACWPNWSIEAISELMHRLDRLTHQKRGFGIVAVSNEGDVLGYGQLTVWPRTTEISDLIVTPNLRGQGIGTAMICALVEHVRGQGLSEVEIGAAVSNPRALALYRRLGFIDNRTIDIDLGHGPEPVIYLKLGLHGQK